MTFLETLTGILVETVDYIKTFVLQMKNTVYCILISPFLKLFVTFKYFRLLILGPTDKHFFLYSTWTLKDHLLIIMLSPFLKILILKSYQF